MTAYKHEDYSTGTARSRRAYLAIMATAALIGGGLAVLTGA